jgi:hypothetical protein
MFTRENVCEIKCLQGKMCVREKVYEREFVRGNDRRECFWECLKSERECVWERDCVWERQSNLT